MTPSPSMRILTLACSLALAASTLGCASESSQVVETKTVATYDTSYSGPRYTLALGKIGNASTYLQGVFTDGDRLGNQAKDILMTHLSQTNRFTLVDRENLDELAFEGDVSGTGQELTGAELMITGAVTEFGRKTTGDKQVFGILGRGKKQTAYSKMSINVVDVRTGEIVHSVQGAGEFALSNREVLGTGGTAGYDSTLNGKVLNLSITDAVNKLVADLERGAWSPR